MKKIFLFLLCATGFTCLNAQSDEGKYYVYGVDFTQAKVYAAQESPQQFAVAFEKINRLLRACLLIPNQPHNFICGLTG